MLRDAGRDSPRQKPCPTAPKQALCGQQTEAGSTAELDGSLLSDVHGCRFTVFSSPIAAREYVCYCRLPQGSQGQS